MSNLAFVNNVEARKIGDECEFIVPWYLAYGSKGVPASSANLVPIPSYSALRFIVKLSGIIPEEDKK